MQKIWMITLFGLINGCALGPNFNRPSPPQVKNYTVEKITKTASSETNVAGNQQDFLIGKKLQAKWWRLFRSPVMNKLISRAIQHNYDLKTAIATLNSAHESTLSQQGAYFPVVTAGFNPTRQLTAGGLQSAVASDAYLYSLFTSSLNIAYMPDVLGLNRRQVESLRADEETACFQKDAVQLTLISNLVLAVIQFATLTDEIDIATKSINIALQQQKLIKKKRLLGQIGMASELQQAAGLATMQSDLLILKKQLAQQQHLIENLCGSLPGQNYLEPISLKSLHLPTQIPLSLPAQLVQQRPDIRAAEAQMHSASAKIGVALTNRLPNISLSAVTGFMPVSFNIKSVPPGFPILSTGFGSGFWGIGANILGKIFDGGALMHQQRAAEAHYEATVMQYKKVVLNAFQNVTDSLKAIQYDAEVLQAAVKISQSTQKQAVMVDNSWRLGAASYLYVLNAQQAYLLARMNLVQKQANRFADTVALFQALGSY